MQKVVHRSWDIGFKKTQNCTTPYRHSYDIDWLLYPPVSPTNPPIHPPTCLHPSTIPLPKTLDLVYDKSTYLKAKSNWGIREFMPYIFNDTKVYVTFDTLGK